VGSHPFEQFQHFSKHGELHVGEASNVAAWSRQVFNEALAERIDHRRKNDRYRAGLLAQRRNRGAAVGQDHIGARLDQLRHKSPRALGVAGGPARVDAKIAAFRPAELAQPLAQRRDARLSYNAVEYKECAPKVPYRRELLELSLHEVARIVLEVVEAEGPIHTEEVARRIREAFGLQRTGQRILAHVREGLKLTRKSGVTRNGEFWSVAGRELSAVRSRRSAPLALKRVAIVSIISETVAISREDLVVETARVFGFDRTGPDLEEAIKQQITQLIRMGRLKTDGDDVLRSGCAPSVSTSASPAMASYGNGSRTSPGSAV
jgi:hypothetical protein